MSPDILLLLMFTAYALPIAFVYSKYQNSATRSISSIITSQEPFISIAENNAPPRNSQRYSNKALSRCVYAADGVFHDSL